MASKRQTAGLTVKQISRLTKRDWTPSVLLQRIVSGAASLPEVRGRSQLDPLLTAHHCRNSAKVRHPGDRLQRHCRAAVKQPV